MYKHKELAFQTLKKIRLCKPFTSGLGTFKTKFLTFIPVNYRCQDLKRTIHKIFTMFPRWDHRHHVLGLEPELYFGTPNQKSHWGLKTRILLTWSFLFPTEIASLSSKIKSKRRGYSSSFVFPLNFLWSLHFYTIHGQCLFASSKFSGEVPSQLQCSKCLIPYSGDWTLMQSK